jgi:hypothetical protein
MNPPFPASPLSLEAAVSDPPVRLDCLEGLHLFHMLFLTHKTHKSTAESWTRKVLLPRSACADGHGLCSYRARKRRHQSGGATRRSVPVGSGDQYESRRERPSRIRGTTAAMSSGVRERLTALLGNRSGSGEWSGCERGSCLLSQMSALLRSGDERSVQKMADLIAPLARQELDNEGEKGGRG